MNMTNAEFNEFKQAAEKALQAELVCSLLEDFPHQLEDGELSAIASLIKKLTGDAYVYMNNVIYQQERSEK